MNILKKLQSLYRDVYILALIFLFSIGVGAAGEAVSHVGDITLYQEQSYGAYARDGGSITLSGDIEMYGTGSHGADAVRNSAIEISGDVLVSADNTVALQATENSRISISGDISISGVDDGLGATFAQGGNSIDIVGNITGETTKYFLLGLYAWTDSTINMSGDVTLSGDASTGAFAADSSTVNLSGDIRVYGNGVPDIPGHEGYGAQTLLGGVVNINGGVFASGDLSFGAEARYGGSGINISGDLIVSGDGSFGAFAAEDSTVNIRGGGASISGTGSTLMQVEENGTVSLHNVTATASGQGTLLAATQSFGSITADGGSDLYGDIINSNNENPNMLSVTLNESSTLTGSINDIVPRRSRTKLTLGDADSAWYVAGDSSFYGLFLDGSTVHYEYSPAFTTVTVQVLDTLAAAGGTFIMKADIARERADMLVAETAYGEHQFKVLNIGSAATTGGEIVTLARTGPESDVEFTLTNIVEYGGWQYALKTANSSQVISLPGGNLYGKLWQLHSRGASNTGDAAVNNFIGSYLMNYAETHTFIQRMGDLRSSPYAAGLWFRAYGGEFESNAGSYVRDFDMDYGGVFVGYDRKSKIGWNGDAWLGVMFGYSKGDLSYSAYGSGEVESKTLGVYGSFVHSNGFYLDAVLKYTWMDNDFDTVDSAGTYVNGGKISSDGAGFSVEAGQRFSFSGKQKNGWYMEPQVQLSYMRYDGGYFNASNGLHIGVEPFTSVLGRLGVLIGFETPGRNFYAKAFRVREFDGELSVRANGSRITESLEGSWWVYGLGFTARLNGRNSVYADIEHTSGGKFRQPWKINAGWRVML